MFIPSGLNAGAHSLSASYVPANNNFLGSPATGTLTVSPGDTQTLLVSSLNPAGSGQSLTFTATARALTPGGVIPSGSATFFDGTTVLATVGLTDGSASFSTSTLTIGTHSITAEFDSNTADYTGSTSAVVSQAVRTTSKTTLAASPVGTSTVGQSVTLTATVTGTGATGSVTFFDGSTMLGTGTLTSGKASLSVSTLAAGSQALTAAYTGNSTFGGSTSTAVAYTVKAAATTVMLGSAPLPSTFGQAVALTATISVTSPGGGSPTGTVTFMEGNKTLGKATVTNNVATLNLITLEAGRHAITAVYTCDTGNYTGSTSAVLTHTVNKAGTTTAPGSALNPANLGQPVTFTATVTSTVPGAAKVDEGTATFKNGSVILGTAKVVNGVATFTTSTLAHGSHAITEVYNPGQDFTTSTSAVLTETVN